MAEKRGVRINSPKSIAIHNCQIGLEIEIPESLFYESLMLVIGL